MNHIQLFFGILISAVSILAQPIQYSSKTARISGVEAGDPDVSSDWFSDTIHLFNLSPSSIEIEYQILPLAYSFGIFNTLLFRDNHYYYNHYFDHYNNPYMRIHIPPYDTIDICDFKICPEMHFDYFGGTTFISTKPDEPLGPFDTPISGIVISYDWRFSSYNKVRRDTIILLGDTATISSFQVIDVMGTVKPKELAIAKGKPAVECIEMNLLGQLINLTQRKAASPVITKQNRKIGPLKILVK